MTVASLLSKAYECPDCRSTCLFAQLVAVWDKTLGTGKGKCVCQVCAKKYQPLPPVTPETLARKAALECTHE